MVSCILRYAAECLIIVRGHHDSRAHGIRGHSVMTWTSNFAVLDVNAKFASYISDESRAFTRLQRTRMNGCDREPN